MTIADRIDMTAEHRRIVLDILETRLPAGTAIWAFGSRVTGRARRYSDLDLAIDAGRRLTIDETGMLREAFDECDLPYGVDLVDWRAISPEFRRLIAADRLRLEHSPAPV
jgi:predicted nucleotidyltransferase